MSSSQAVLGLDHIQAWVEETEQVLSSQASFDTFQPAEVEEIVSRFQAVLDSNLNCQEVAQMVKAVSVLMYVTRNLANMRYQLLNLLQSVLASFLSSSEKDQLSRELNDEVLDLMAQCGEDKEVKMMMLEGLAGQMLAVIANSNLVDLMRKSWLKTFNILLSGSNYKLRELLGREFAEDIEQLVDFLYTCGEYDTQSSLVETLLRFTSKADRPQLAMTWFPNYALVQSLFVRIKDFETDCRNFLNCFNHGLGDNQLVFTLPALTCQLGKLQMFKPPDNKYRQFWVDFNLRPGSISIFHVKEEKSTDLWDLLTITHEMVTSASITTQAGSTVLTLSLPTTQAVLFFTPDPQLSQLVRQLFDHKAAAAKPAANPTKCSRAAGQLLLPKNSRLPPAVTSAQPPAVIHSSVPRSVQTGGRMSVAALPVKVDSKVGQAAHHMGHQGEVVRYERCSQAQPVRLMAKRKEAVENIALQEDIEKLANDKRLEEPLETVEANDRMMKASYLERFDIKKMRECRVVIDRGARVKAGEAFQAKTKKEAFEAAEKKLKEDEARERSQAKERAEAEEKKEARVAAEKNAYDDAVELKRVREETEKKEKAKLKADKEAALAKAEEEGRIVEKEALLVEQRAVAEAETKARMGAAAMEKVKMEAKAKAKSEKKAMIEARAKEEKERVKAKEKKKALEEAKKQERIKASEEDARVAKEKKAVDDAERGRVEAEKQEKSRLEAEKEALAKAEKEEQIRVEVEAIEKARVITEKRAVDEAEKKVREEVAAKEKVEAKQKAKAEKKAKKAARAKEEEEKAKSEDEKRIRDIAEMETLTEVSALEVGGAKEENKMKADKEMRVFKEANETNEKTMREEARKITADQKTKDKIVQAASALNLENEGDCFLEKQDEFEDMVEIDNKQEEKISETPKSWNFCPESEADYFSVSPTTSFTMSGGRRRAKRKLSITKRNIYAMTKAKSIKLSFNSSNSVLSFLPPESSAMLESSPRACSPPPHPNCPPSPQWCSPTTIGLAQQETKQQKTKNPGREGVSPCPDLRKVGEDAPGDVEMDSTDGRINKMDHVKKARRSSFKKLLSNKSLLLEMDVAESSTRESVFTVPSSKVKVKAPSYDEVYRRENKKLKDDRKVKVLAKHPTKSKSTAKLPNNSAEDYTILPPLVVSRISNTTDLTSSLMSTSIASSKKFFKTKFRQSIGSSISSWTDSILGGGKKKRKTYSKTVVRKTTPGAGSQNDPYNTLAISPLVEKVILKVQQKSNRSSRLFSDEEVEITKTETADKNPSSIIASKKTSAMKIQKGIKGKRKPSPSLALFEEPDEATLLPSPPMLQSLPSSFHMQPDQECAGDGGDQDMGELETVLICTMRVLEMMARKGRGEAKYRKMWGEIRRIAEGEEGR